MQHAPGGLDGADESGETFTEQHQVGVTFGEIRAAGDRDRDIGCGEHPGENQCKGMGECAVPLSDKAWAKARKNFEAAMKKAGKKFGDAPKKAT